MFIPKDLFLFTTEPIIVENSRNQFGFAVVRTKTSTEDKNTQYCFIFTSVEEKAKLEAALSKARRNVIDMGTLGSLSSAMTPLTY